MATLLINEPSILQGLLISLVNGEQSIYLTTLTQSLSYGGNLFLPVEGLAIKNLTDSLDLEPSSPEIELPLDSHPGFEQLSLGTPHPLTTVAIQQVFDPRNTPEVYTLFKGTLKETIRHPKKAVGLLRLVCTDVRHHLDKPAGVSANLQCAWVFGDANCGIVPATEAVTVLAIGELSVDISRSFIITDLKFGRGYLELDGLRIMIRNWIIGDRIYLAKQPPSHWLNASVTLTGGCAKSYAACASLYSNEASFGGFGYGMVPYNPITEAP